MAGKTVRFRLDGQIGKAEREALEREIRAIDGVADFALAESGKAGMVSTDTDRAAVATIFSRIEERGYSVSSRRRSGEEAEEDRRHSTLLRLLVAAAFSMQVMLVYLSFLYGAYRDASIPASTIRNFHIFLALLTTPVLWYGGYPILSGAYGALKRRTANMNTLVSLGLLSAYGYSLYVALTGKGEAYFDAVAMITTVIMLGRYIETLGGDSARKGIRALLNLQPETAVVRRDDAWVAAAASELREGDSVLVRSGERVPADLRVEEGRGEGRQVAYYRRIGARQRRIRDGALFRRAAYRRYPGLYGPRLQLRVAPGADYAARESGP